MGTGSHYRIPLRELRLCFIGLKSCRQLIVGRLVILTLKRLTEGIKRVVRQICKAVNLPVIPAIKGNRIVFCLSSSRRGGQSESRPFCCQSDRLIGTGGDFREKARHLLL